MDDGLRRRLRVLFGRELLNAQHEILGGLSRYQADQDLDALYEVSLALHGLRGSAASLQLTDLTGPLTRAEAYLRKVSARQLWPEPRALASLGALASASADLAPAFASGEQPQMGHLGELLAPLSEALDPPAPARARAPRADFGRPKVRVVIADDSQVCRVRFRELLEADGGFEIVGVAENGMEALERTRASLPDVVLMDVVMPYLNGIEATHRIFHEIPTPVVLVTGHDKMSRLDPTTEGFEAAAVAVVAKPIEGGLGADSDPRGLLAALRRVASIPVRRRQVEPADTTPPARLPRPDQVAPAAPPSGRPRILVVEDSPTQAEALVDSLAEYGFEVRYTADASAGWEEAFRDPPDLILSDLILPGGSGFDLTRALRSCEATRRVSVVLLTGNGNPMDMLRGFSAGVDAFLSKPYQPHQLAAQLRQVLARPVSTSGSDQAVKEVHFRGEDYWLPGDHDDLIGFMMAAFEDYVRAQTELEALRLSRRADAEDHGLVAALLEALPHPALVVDAGGQILGANGGGRGLADGQLWPEAWSALAPSARAACAEAARGGSPPSIPFLPRRSEGPARHFLVDARPLGATRPDLMLLGFRDAAPPAAQPLRRAQSP